MFSNAGEVERKSGTRDNSVAIGVQANEKTVRWLYDQHLAGLVGDTVAFEAWPPKFTDGWCLHEWLLVHWGMYMMQLDAPLTDQQQVRRLARCGILRNSVRDARPWVGIRSS
jgi:hypothetical protein